MLVELRLEEFLLLWWQFLIQFPFGFCLNLVRTVIHTSRLNSSFCVGLDFYSYVMGLFPNYETFFTILGPYFVNPRFFLLILFWTFPNFFQCSNCAPILFNCNGFYFDWLVQGPCEIEIDFDRERFEHENVFRLAVVWPSIWEGVHQVLIALYHCQSLLSL